MASPLQDFKTHELISFYRRLRQERDKLEAEHKQRMDPLKQKMDVLDGELMRRLNEEKSATFSTEAGKFTRVLKTFYNVTDPVEFNKFIVEEAKDVSFLNKKPSSTAVTAYKDRTGELPPGITATQQYESRFTPVKD